MNFKKLEVYGFKSFADKLVVEFGEGITAIVGPNGCGKSNVADSIRWALGEQSAKTLRGSQMLDVIFSGTERRKSMSYCEVSLYFDNSKRIFDCEYDEVVITRKLYKNLESVYSINKQEARLKDITALLHDSGLGKDSYSIIGQGRIDEILSAKAEDRRAIFEDAAGISKHKHIKLDNERKLNRVQEKLDRVSDILKEQEKQLVPLAAQAETAKRAFILKDTLRTLEVNTYLYQHDTAESRKAAIQERINGLDEELALRKREYEQANEDYANALDAVSGIDETIQNLNQERLRINVTLVQQVGEGQLLQSRIASLKEKQEILQHEIDRCTKELEESNAMLSKHSEEKTATHEEIALHQQNVSALSARYLEVSEELMKNEGEVEQRHLKALEAMERLAEIKANMSRLNAEKTSLEERVADCRKKEDILTEKISAEQLKAESVQAQLNAVAARRSALIREAQAKSDAYNESLIRIRELAVKIDQTNEQLHVLQANLKMMRDVQNNMQGFVYSVRRLVQDSKSDPALSSRIEGHIASLIKVEAKYESAIEMSLGNAIQNIVVQKEEDAKFLIEYLKRKQYGRATFLPITAVHGRGLENHQRSYLRRLGVCGVACELLEYDKKYEDIMKSLLGRTVIVDNIDTAIRLAKESNYTFRIVTLEGDIIATQGSLTGGSKKSEINNILGTERQIAETAEKLEAAQKEMAELVAERGKLIQFQETAMEGLKTLTDEKHRIDVEFASHTELLKSCDDQLTRYQAEYESLQEEAGGYIVKFTAIDTELKSVDELERIAAGAKTTGSETKADAAQFEALKKQRDELHVQLTDEKVALAAAQTQLGNIERDIMRLKSAILNNTSLLEDAHSKMRQNKSQLEIEEAAAAGKADNSENISEDELREKLTEIETKLNDLDKYKKQCQENMLSVDGRRQDSQTQLGRISELKYKQIAEQEQIDSQLQFYTERISQEYELNYESCQQYRTDDFDISKSNVEANKIKRELIRMGNVNMHAVQDYEQLKERYDEESEQKEDLEKSILDIKAVIADMTKEMLIRFNKHFELIRTNFIQCFKQLFGGGNADLILEEGADPLEAGIDVVAEPPGKKLQSISLLSGGERALTAIAILFAILRLKPMPFCILDEIEAALDDANVERFAKYLHNFSQRTQFIVITHRKPTMELADSLYGVTMEEKGVSKIVSVKLSEAVKMDNVS